MTQANFAGPNVPDAAARLDRRLEKLELLPGAARVIRAAPGSALGGRPFISPWI